MQYPTLPAEKFEQLLTYLDTLGIDPNDVLAAAGLVDSYIFQQPKETSLPAVHYSRLYKCAVTAMQAIDSRVPWAGARDRRFRDVVSRNYRQRYPSRGPSPR